MFSFLSKLGFSQGQPLGNFELVKKYAPLNEKAAKSINNTELNRIIEETRRISPKISEIHQQINATLKEQSYTKLTLQSFVIDKLTNADLLPSMAGYQGFPCAIAISVNNELIHNIPDDSEVKPGSIVTVEIGASSNKAYTSQTWSYLVPIIDHERKKLLNAAKLALKNAVNIVAPEVKLGDIGNAIQQTIESKGYSVVREFCGFGMGKQRIMEPQILGYGRPGTGPKIKSNQILNIHIMAVDGKSSIKLHENGWGLAANTGNNSVALSTMVLVTETGYELLTSIQIK